MYKLFIYVSFIAFVFTACGTQKKLADAAEKNRRAKEEILKDSATLKALQQKVDNKKANKEVDDTINNKIDAIVISLKSELNKIQKTVDAVDFFLQNKRNFSPRKYERNVANYVNQLDSFQLQQKTRERIYALLVEAVRVEAFHKYGMGAFYEPGVYRITPNAFTSINQYFQPAIDSLAALSNRFPDVKRTAHLVIVGYADAVPISSETGLYQEIKSHLKNENPDPAQLNQGLSDLRAQELLRNLRIIMQSNAAKFIDYNKLQLGYVSYGRGQELPFNNIKDYTENDDRRRVVVFYWAILPDLEK